MSKLSEMIATLCPNGVEYKKLGEVATIERGSGLKKKVILWQKGFPVSIMVSDFFSAGEVKNIPDAGPTRLSCLPAILPAAQCAEHLLCPIPTGRTRL